MSAGRPPRGAGPARSARTTSNRSNPIARPQKSLVSYAANRTLDGAMGILERIGVLDPERILALTGSSSTLHQASDERSHEPSPRRDRRSPSLGLERAPGEPDLPRYCFNCGLADGHTERDCSVPKDAYYRDQFKLWFNMVWRVVKDFRRDYHTSDTDLPFPTIPPAPAPRASTAQNPSSPSATPLHAFPPHSSTNLPETDEQAGLRDGELFKAWILHGLLDKRLGVAELARETFYSELETAWNANHNADDAIDMCCAFAAQEEITFQLKYINDPDVDAPWRPGHFFSNLPPFVHKSAGMWGTLPTPRAPASPVTKVTGAVADLEMDGA